MLSEKCIVTSALSFLTVLVLKINNTSSKESAFFCIFLQIINKRLTDLHLLSNADFLLGSLFPEVMNSAFFSGHPPSNEKCR